MNKIFFLVILQIAAINCLNSIKADGNCGDVPKNCTVAGPLCKNCTTLVSCIDPGDGNFIEVPNQDCAKTSQWCSEQTSPASCSSDPNPICDGTACLDFICTGDGIFLDPFDCTKYHICIMNTTTTLAHKQKQCDAGFIYNAKTTFCEPGNCPVDYPVPLCKNAADSAAVGGNPSYYYICENYPNTTTLYPKIYLCQNSEIYSDYKCNPV